jgi:hypothetical protein
MELIEIIKAASKITLMELSESAKEKWGEIYPDLSKDNDGLTGMVINRAEAQVLRISMIYSLLDLEAQGTIEIRHLEAALAVWQYCEDSARFIFSNRESNSYAEKIYNFLKGGPKSKTDIYTFFKRKILKRQLDSALKELTSKGKICTEKVKNKTLFKRSDKSEILSS